MTLQSRQARVLAICVFVVGMVACGYWAYQSLAWVLPSWGNSGSGGVGAVSVGIIGFEPLLLLSPLGTFLLTNKRITGTVGTWLRWIHLLVTVVMIVVAISSASRNNPLPAIVVASVFLPVQAFFLVAAIALRLSRVGR